MRRNVGRAPLPPSTRKRLQAEANRIAASIDPSKEAKACYAKARKAKWFQPILAALKGMAGAGERCMFCSGSEASDVEHYRPKSVFPEVAMDWENFLWACTICNRAKANRFPPDTEPGGLIINPVDDDPWAYFFIDEFGLLTAKFDPSINSLDARALSTIEVLKLNREALTDSRKSRLDDLVKHVEEWLSAFNTNRIDATALARKVEEYRKQPFQSDVADYYLNGPGKAETPFRALFHAMGTGES